MRTIVVTVCEVDLNMNESHSASSMRRKMLLFAWLGTSLSANRCEVGQH